MAGKYSSQADSLRLGKKNYSSRVSFMTFVMELVAGALVNA